ncbi:MAG: carboxymethylenebutenolidase [Rhodospirillales bacterium]|nr:carboxymethylenebutenolidase [Rhodospirillales bacterium]
MTEVLIDATDAGRFGAYLAEPAGTGSAPGMLVIQEIFGINQNVRSICDDYAAQGYVAIAPDLFWRQEPGLQLDSNSKEGWKRAMELLQGFSETKGIEDLIATLAWLRTHPRVSAKVGTVGYCLGGKLAYLMSTRSDVDAAVGYYGVGIEGSIGEAGAITHPLMLHVAEKDGFSSPEAQKAIRDGLAPIVHATVHTYPGVDHAFARKGGDHYDANAANLADGRTASFFAHILKA